MSPLTDLFCGCSSPSRCPATTTKIMGDAPLIHTISAAIPSRRSSKINECVVACDYEPDLTDTLDVKLASQLLSLEREFAMTLRVRRIAAGDYELDGRRLKLYLASNDNRSGKRDIFVKDELQQVNDHVGVTLATHLKQARVSNLDVSAYVAASLGGKSPGSPAVARVPPDKRLSFAVGPNFASSRDLSDGIPTDRLTCMKVACEEARLREHAAEAYERSSADGRGRNYISSPPIRSASGGSLSASSSVASLRGASPTGSVRVTPKSSSPSPCPPPMPKLAVTAAAVPKQKTPYDAGYVRSSSMPPPIPVSPTSPKEPWGRASTSGALPTRSKPPMASSVQVSSPLVNVANAAPRAYSRSPTPPPTVQVGTSVITSVSSPSHRPYSRSPTPPQLPSRPS